MFEVSKYDTVRKILEIGLLPTFHNPKIETVQKIIESCLDAGAEVIEFTNRGPSAYRVFSELVTILDPQTRKVILGVGTIIDPPTASLYINNGAKFIVGPVFDPEIAKICNRRKIPYIPGCSTCTEIFRAEEMGAEIVKVFPAKVLGPYFLKSVLGPFPWLKLMPSGGLEPTREDISRWVESGAAALNIGGNLISRDMIESKDFAGIRTKVRNTIQWIKEARKRHRKS